MLLKDFLFVTTNGRYGKYRFFYENDNLFIFIQIVISGLVCM